MNDIRQARSGCARHLLLIGALLVAALAIFLVRNPDAVQRLFADQAALREGADVARSLETPDDLLAWMAEHPEHASLVVIDLDDSTRSQALAPDVERPLAGLPVLLSLRAFAQTADTAAALPAALRETAALGLVAQRVNLDSVRIATATDAARAAASGSAYAADLLGGHVGWARLGEAAQRIGVGAPRPFAGLLAAWFDADSAGTLRPVADWSDQAVTAFERLRRSDDARAAARAQLQGGGLGFSLQQQRDAAAASFPRGTAAAYARLLAQTLADTTEAGRIALDLIARPLPDSSDVDALGLVAGAFPGVVGLAASVQSPRRPRGRVVILTLSDLPLAVFYHLAQTGLDTGLVLQLALDPAVDL